MRHSILCGTAIVLASLLTDGCICSRRGREGGGESFPAETLQYVQAFKLDHAKARADLAELSASPHAFGSARQARISDWLATRLAEGGLSVARDEFTAETPNPQALGEISAPVALTLTKSGANLVASQTVTGHGMGHECVVAVGSHFDTKILADVDYVGANDSGSSTVALLQMLPYLRSQLPPGSLSCDIVGLFFDGEEAVLFDWNDGLSHPAQLEDNTYGSRHFASRLSGCSFGQSAAKCLPASFGGKPLVALVLLDMVGSPAIRLSRDQNSTPSLLALAERAAGQLGRPEVFEGAPLAIADDHLPFAKRGVAVVDLIDFHQLDYWHREGDTIDKISFESIEIAARIGLLSALTVAANPKVFLRSAEP